MLEFVRHKEQTLSVDWNDRTRTALDIIQGLAAEHGVTPAVTKLDEFCDDMARLAGDDVKLDPVEQTIANIGKLRLYDGKDLTRLHARYLSETATK